MVSLSVSSEYVILTFVSKVVVFRRLPDDRLAEERVLLIEETKTGQTAVTDGATPAVCSALSRRGKYFAAACGKKLTLWETADWTALGSKNIVRAASCVAFSSSEDEILLSDKSGDAYLFNKDDFDTCDTPESAHMLGHVSMLLRITSSPDDRFVITCDRDEKIRVSHLPNAYNIQTYCLGHEDAVTCLDIPSAKPDLLISGSSDGTVRFWEFSTGKQLLCHNFPADSLIVDLVSLPIDEQSFLICVICKKIKSVSLLHLSIAETLECMHLEDVPISCETPLSLIVNKHELFVLSVDSPDFVQAFKSHGKSLIPCQNLNDNLRNSLRKFNDDFTSVTENILDDRLFTYLNKRKIDDTQEYYKRKHERLVGGNSK